MEGKLTPEEHEKNVEHLVKGVKMTKYGRKGFPHRRGIRVTLDKDAIISHFTVKVWFKDIIEIRKGQNTAVFERQPDPTTDHLSFSVVYNSPEEGERSLDLVVDNEDEYAIWMTTLPLLVEEYKTAQRVTHKRKAFEDVVSAPDAKVPAKEPEEKEHPREGETTESEHAEGEKRHSEDQKKE